MSEATERVSKKVRKRSTEPSNSDDPVVDGAGLAVNVLEICMFKSVHKPTSVAEEDSQAGSKVESSKTDLEEQFGPWMLVERRQKRSTRPMMVKTEGYGNWSKFRIKI